MKQHHYQNSKVFRHAEIYTLITSIKNIAKRNLLRGYVAKPHITPDEVEALRRGNSYHDSRIVGAILKGPHGLLCDPKKKKKSADLITMTSFPPLDWKNEICYTAGYLNSMQQAASEMLAVVKELVQIETMETDCALALLLNLSKQQGASNYLSYKLAYLRRTRYLSAALLDVVSQIEDEILHRDSLGFHFSALENLSSEISLFVIAQRRISELVGMVNGDIRKALTLSNFVPTPLDEQDVAGFLLRATESCLLDTVHAVLIIFNLAEGFNSVQKEFKRHLNSAFVKQLEDVLQFAAEAGTNSIVKDYYRSEIVDRERSLDLYRVSAAFLERPKFAIYRNKLDRVIGVRLLGEITGRSVHNVSHPFNNKGLLLAPSDAQPDEDLPITLDAFYRSFLFLSFIGHKQNLLNLSSDELKFVFENTIGLEALLTEEEMKTLYNTASDRTKSLVAVLSLALYRRKSVDPDIDYAFRADFISHINAEHDGSILAFINYLLSDSPQVASYIVNSLDEVTLEKMYGLVENESQASEIRCEILRAVGQKLNRLEYIIKADEITTRSKVSKLIKYFDSSRMYVDSVSMKKWLDSNPTISTEQYRALYPRVNAGSGDTYADEYLISQIAKDAFEQFCLNTEFGIESYLGRRIRHNTLDGVTTDTVDTVLRKPGYQNATSSPSMRKTVETWMSSYKSIIDKLRREHLQFKSSCSLFKSTLDLKDSTTKENLRWLASELRSAGGCELLNDLIISFCWKQISPQLEHAARFIRTTLLQEAYSSIDKHFSGDYSAVETQIRSELHQAVNEVFRKIADWFQVPQTGFVSASVKDLCQIILLEVHRQNVDDKFAGDSIDTKYTGIGVHRLYDCLAVLLQNAHKHGEVGRPILVNAHAIRPVTESVLNLVTVNIASTVSKAKYAESKQRILKAIASAEAGTDMITEGYTGIKKIKFITRASEGRHTIRCDAKDDTCELTLIFTVHGEPAIEEVQTGIAS